MNNETFMREYLTNLIFKILDKTIKVLFNRVQMNESKRPDTKGSLNNMKLPESRFCKETRVVKTSRVFPLDTNNHNTLFGGKLMSYIDDIASISAARHCRCETVTASMDSVDFCAPSANRIPYALNLTSHGSAHRLWRCLLKSLKNI